MDSWIPCRTCGQPQSKNGTARGGGYCPTCEQAFRRQASEWQERDYLHAYLFTRQEEDSHELRHLRTKAERLGIDWRSEPPPPLTFDQRLAQLSGRAPRKPRTRKQVAA